MLGVVQPSLELVASVDPRVVFASLAAQCVPELCDDCTIDLTDGSTPGDRIVYPERSTPAGDLGRLVERAAQTADHVARVHFAHLTSPGDTGRSGRDEARVGESFHGVVTFVWRWRAATRADRTMAAVLVDHAVRTVVWQRSERAADAAAADAENLRIALQTNRHIGTALGILMGQHKINQDEAFELLRLASQHGHGKVRDLALDVIDAGCLDPALLDSAGVADAPLARAVSSFTQAEGRRWRRHR